MQYEKKKVREREDSPSDNRLLDCFEADPSTSIVETLTGVGALLIAFLSFCESELSVRYFLSCSHVRRCSTQDGRM